MDDLQPQRGQLAVDWAEFISRTGVSPTATSLSWHGGSQAVVVIDVDFSKIEAGADGTNPIEGACQQILGFAERVPPPPGFAPGTVGTISRTPPIRHPLLPHMVCTKISKIDYLAPDVKKGLITAQAEPYMGWKRARLTCLYESVDYTILNDTDFQGQPYNGNEACRYVSGPYYLPTISGIQRQPQQNGGFQWPAGAPFPGGNKFLNFGITKYLPKVGIQLKWNLVPEASLFRADLFPGMLGYPLGAFRAIGSVDSTNDGSLNGYMNFPTGTLFYEVPKLEPVPSPFPLSSNFKLPQRLWNCTYNLRFIQNSPNGIANTPAGWNTIQNPVDDKWYTITDSQGNMLYPTVAFSGVLFQSL